ncbi:hypothetical protein WN51_05591 [Melipona quadrifasciata]|uniref:Uncharacterized protein n=1 Tax=Melipona quadrifasciata TaxID=166423 RepID=A0A0N0U3B0_9HYME|nr:hypothetical protein WN51_05591 [Melipona quadrifasciata]
MAPADSATLSSCTLDTDDATNAPTQSILAHPASGGAPCVPYHATELPHHRATPHASQRRPGTSVRSAGRLAVGSRSKRRNDRWIYFKGGSLVMYDSASCSYAGALELKGASGAGAAAAAAGVTAAGVKQENWPYRGLTCGSTFQRLKESVDKAKQALADRGGYLSGAFSPPPRANPSAISPTASITEFNPNNALPNETEAKMKVTTGRRV